MREKLKKKLLPVLPFLPVWYAADKLSWLYRSLTGADPGERLLRLLTEPGDAFRPAWPSLHPVDMIFGGLVVLLLAALLYLKKQEAKKFRQGTEYGSARWGTTADIRPYEDPDPEKNIILTQTEKLTMNSRPKDPKLARNKNVLVIGGSGSGKTRFFVKPNLMQMHASYCVTDPKGTILVECGRMLERGGYAIKVLNTINFRKSMHYNPFTYIRSEKDILKLVNTIIANTKGEGEKAGEDFWVKAEKLYYQALIGYLWYEAPKDEMNFSTLLELINASEAREEDEDFKNAVDLLFEDLEAENPEHFAVRQYKKYKLAAGVITSKRRFNTGDKKVRVGPILEVFTYKERRTLLCRKATSQPCMNVCPGTTSFRVNRTVSATRKGCSWILQRQMTCHVRCISRTTGSPAPALTDRASWK